MFEINTDSLITKKELAGMLEAAAKGLPIVLVCALANAHNKGEPVDLLLIMGVYFGAMVGGFFAIKGLTKIYQMYQEKKYQKNRVSEKERYQRHAKQMAALQDEEFRKNPPTFLDDNE